MTAPLLPAAHGSLAAADPAAWPAAADWQPILEPFWRSAAGLGLLAFLRERLQAGACIYPPQPLRALALTPLAAVRVVILGQDPYHGPGQAEGLAFSVPPGVRPPPSLRHIWQEVCADRPAALARAAAHGSLAHWARQGVLLLNTSLTVEDGQPASHAGKGWEVLTDLIISALDADPSPKAFLLWGAHAQAKAGLLRQATHLRLSANHPSPLSARRPPQPFLGCGHFRQVDDWLARQGLAPLAWLPD